MAELWNTAVLVHETFKKTGCFADLDQAVDLYTRLEEDNGYQDHVDSPHDLQLRLLSVLEFQITLCGRLDQVEKMMEIAQKTYQICSRSCTDYPAVLATLGSALLCRYSISRQHGDLDSSLVHLELSLELCPSESLHRPLCLLSLGNTLRAMDSNSPNVLVYGRATDVIREAVSILGSPDELRAQIYQSLTCLLMNRYLRVSGANILEEALEAARKSLELYPPGHPLSARMMHITSEIMRAHFGISNNLAELDEAISLGRNSISLLHPQSTQCIALLASLGSYLGQRSEISRNLQDLDEAIGLCREGLSLNPCHVGLSRQLGCCLCTKFQYTLHISDLDASIVYFRQSLSASKNSTNTTHVLLNLGIALSLRYRELRQSADIDESAEMLQKALPLMKQDPHYMLALYYLGTILIRRDSCLSDIEEAIHLLRKAVPRSGGLYLFYDFQELARALSRRFEYLGNLQDIEEAFEYLEKALNLECIMPFHRELALLALARGYYTRYRVSSSKEDYTKALTIYLELQSTEMGPLERYECNQWLADMYLERQGLVSCFEKGAQLVLLNLGSIQRGAQLRLLDTVKWIRKVPRDIYSGDQTGKSALLGVYRGAVQLLPRVAYFGTGIKDRLLALRYAEELSSHGAACALSLSRAEDALEILEQGRGVFWTQALQLRTPLDQVPHDLRAQLTELSRRLEVHSYAPDMEHRSKEAAEREETRNREETEQFNEILAKIRLSPGLERFLLHEPAADLVEASASGPVVVLLASRNGCYALAVGADCYIRTMELRDVDAQWLAATSQTWEGLTAASRNRNRDAGRLQMKKRVAPDRHALQESQVLLELWNRVVHPVFSLLSLEPKNGPDRPRLWWIPTGMFSFLPLHAAGSAHTRCSSFVVSSYSPTLTTLLNLRRSHRPVARNGAQILLGAVPSAPSQDVQDLPQTITEVNGIFTELATLTGNAHSVHVKQSITVQDFVESLPRTNILHLACHGQQDPQNALESRFILHDGPVSIATLMPLPLPNAFFAFLSACETAKGDNAQPDQLIHLAAAMLFAGFKSVIGTMWNMNDHDGPFVSKIVYEQLFGGGGDFLDPDVVPYALDDAIQQLRDQGVSPSRWATYIHLGM